MDLNPTMFVVKSPVRQPKFTGVKVDVLLTGNKIGPKHASVIYLRYFFVLCHGVMK